MREDSPDTAFFDSFIDLPADLGFYESPQMRELRAIYDKAVEDKQPKIVDRLYGEYNALLRDHLDRLNENADRKERLRNYAGSLVMQAVMLKKAGEEEDFNEVLAYTVEIINSTDEQKTSEDIVRLIDTL